MRFRFPKPLSRSLCSNSHSSGLTGLMRSTFGVLALAFVTIVLIFLMLAVFIRNKNWGMFNSLCHRNFVRF